MVGRHALNVKNIGPIGLDFQKPFARSRAALAD
jgi:hypothetical protein